ncbi:hypothetical protein CAPTEDRAFT_194099 [Capitella teleta]|uniref:Uncharacterized protein n=1 Tax=Capitella teleta TaxID=283909 RepID=R7UCB6_CAPTE|nr:hypothetical protein CAPTEDRAFT_194099 [Capitella teleta]|eukprot:ELU00907.1 hypothetical protein CAPTEDRAFT_194099 [Capitella teleta]
MVQCLHFAAANLYKCTLLHHNILVHDGQLEAKGGMEVPDAIYQATVKTTADIEGSNSLNGQLPLTWIAANLYKCTLLHHNILVHDGQLEAKGGMEVPDAIYQATVKTTADIEGSNSLNGQLPLTWIGVLSLANVMSNIDYITYFVQCLR